MTAGWCRNFSGRFTVLLGDEYRVTLRCLGRNRTCLRSSSTGGGSGDAPLRRRSVLGRMAALAAGLVGRVAVRILDAMARVCDASTFIMAVDVLVLVLHCLAVRFEGACVATLNAGLVESLLKGQQRLACAVSCLSV